MKNLICQKGISERKKPIFIHVNRIIQLNFILSQHEIPAKKQARPQLCGRHLGVGNRALV